MLYKIKWVGKNTSMNITWTEYADTYKELFNILIDKNMIHYENYERYIYNKYNVCEEDFYNEDGNFMENKYNELMEKVITEEEYKELIYISNGNAYYQTFYEWNEDTKEYE